MFLFQLAGQAGEAIKAVKAAWTPKATLEDLTAVAAHATKKWSSIHEGLDVVPPELRKRLLACLAEVGSNMARAESARRKG